MSSSSCDTRRACIRLACGYIARQPDAGPLVTAYGEERSLCDSVRVPRYSPFGIVQSCCLAAWRRMRYVQKQLRALARRWDIQPFLLPALKPD